MNHQEIIARVARVEALARVSDLKQRATDRALRELEIETHAQMRFAWGAIPLAGGDITLVRTLADPKSKWSALARRDGYARGDNAAFPPVQNHAFAHETAHLLVGMFASASASGNVLDALADTSHDHARVRLLHGLESLATFVEIIWRTTSLIERWPCAQDEVRAL